MRTQSRTGSRALAGIAVLLLVVVSGVRAQDLQDTVESGWKALQEGKLADARAAFQSVLDAAPNYDFGWYALGQVAMREGKYDEAIDHFKKANELKPDDFKHYYGLAAAFRTQHEYAKAVATLNNSEQYAADRENQYYLHLERGLSYLSLKQYKRAAADLQQAVEIQPGDFTAEQRLGMALAGTHDYAGAVEHLKKAAAKKPKDYTTELYLARALLNTALDEPDKGAKANDYAEAVRAAQAANTARPGFDAQNLLARAYLGSGQFDKAAEAFQAVLKSKSDYCPARHNLGQAYTAQESWEAASEILSRAAECDPKNTAVLNLLGLSYSKQERREEALAAYGKSYALKADARVAENIDRVKRNIDIAMENAAIDTFNAEQIAARELEAAEHARLQAEFEAQQKKIEQYKEATDDN